MKTFLTILGVIAVIGIGFGAYLTMTLSRNGPALLTAIDRVAGGDGGASELEVASTGSHPAQKLHVWGAEDAAGDDRPVLVFVHGGGWRSGDPGTYGYFGRAFVPEGFIVVLAGYRLGEDGVYPGMLEDTASAIAWTKANIARHGGDPERIVLAGHSAGAYNVVQVALEDRWLAAHGHSPADISGVIGMAGPYDFAPFKSDSTIAAFGHVEDAGSTQPINHVSADAPQMLLINGQKDELVGARNARVLAEKLEAAGGQALTILPQEMDHNGPIVSLAAPWRGNSDFFDLVSGFAIAVTNEARDVATTRDEVSVPVQDETG
ncbi:carboxylesterase family protein [Erythrobacter sp. NAP1]|uniref:alpha/beta hydrolase n=1 Tax=Erythrobacter sp. NAP1 TaxID=237727 RepID=UPI0000687857|nr:alpha/beta hydrolase [Erythrobacter sp. NAP1]EAQ28600.1 carboxylesterase family protein [Erythrobacter sp. NAP1]